MIIGSSAVNRTSMTMETSSECKNGVSLNLVGRYLAFALGEESCGVAVRSVREIIGLTGIASGPEPRSCPHGMINLRGKVIPILDLRIRFQPERVETTERTCVIVTQVKSAGGSNSLMGIIVDAVEEVISVAAVDLEEACETRSKLPAHYLLGTVRVNGKTNLLLDLGRLVKEATPVTGEQTVEAA